MKTAVVRPILVMGTTGQVGAETLPLLGGLGPVIGITRADLDLKDAAAIRSVVRSLNPRWIVNAAAYTAVDKAESDKETAFAVNGDAPGILGEEAARIGAPVIHFSTDYVFSGDGTRQWSEDDPTGPLNVYGASKLAGEKALAESGAAHLIFRTSWIFSLRGRNFLLTMLKLAQERDELQVVDDQYGAPTWAGSLAQLVAQRIAQVEKEAMQKKGLLAEVIAPISGIYHACSTGCTTWFGFAAEIVRLAKVAQPEVRFATLIAVPSEAYLTSAERPKNSKLSLHKLNQMLGFQMPSWQQATYDVMSRLSLDGDRTQTLG